MEISIKGMLSKKSWFINQSPTRMDDLEVAPFWEATVSLLCEIMLVVPPNNGGIITVIYHYIMVNIIIIIIIIIMVNNK